MSYPIKVLVVDDPKSDRMIVGRILELCDVPRNSITFASCGVHAVTFVESNDYDAVFLDINMPVMNGLLTAQVIRGQNPRTKIVGVSSNKDEDLPCFDSYVQKPFKRDQFRAVLDRFFARRDVSLSEFIDTF